MTAYQTRHCIRTPNKYKAACYRLLKHRQIHKKDTHGSERTHILYKKAIKHRARELILASGASTPFKYNTLRKKKAKEK